MENTQATLPCFPQQDGIFVLNKPAGPSSAACLKIFKQLGQKKVGHAGTLDPFARGVLLVLLGQATKLSGWLMKGGDKQYRGILKLGITTDTWDITGKILNESPWQNLADSQIEDEIKSWLQLREQQVPSFSAAKHQGQPLYKLARKGIDIPVKIKKIKVSEAMILNINRPFVSFRVCCSSGSYIRSLAHSLGARLGCGATLVELVRECSEPFTIDQACNPEDLENRPQLLCERLLPMEMALPDWPVYDLSYSELEKVKNGMRIPAPEMAGDMAVLRFKKQAVALAQLAQGGNGLFWQVLRGLWN